MTAYWLLFSLPIVAAFFGSVASQNWQPVLWIGVTALLIVFVGLRAEVGGDWPAYDRMVNDALEYPFARTFFMQDPAYYVLNWVSACLTGSVYLVNLCCAVIAVLPLMLFCRTRSQSWAILVAAIPYLIIVVFMGYTRQASAIGLCIAAIMMLENRRIWAALALVLLAALFHKAAAGFLIPVVLLSAVPASEGSVRRTISVLVIAGLFLWYLLVGRGGEIATAVDSYVSTGADTTDAGSAMSSAGAVPRLALSFLAGIVVVLIQRRAIFEESGRIWLLIAVASAFLFILSFQMSTIADRLGLFLIPVHLHAVGLVGNYASGRIRLLVFWTAILGFHGSLLYVWLTRSQYAQGWLPYDNLLLNLI